MVSVFMQLYEVVAVPAENRVEYDGTQAKSEVSHGSAPFLARMCVYLYRIALLRCINGWLHTFV